jgi:hypothetical protein
MAHDASNRGVGCDAASDNGDQVMVHGRRPANFADHLHRRICHEIEMGIVSTDE